MKNRSPTLRRPKERLNFARRHLDRLELHC